MVFMLTMVLGCLVIVVLIKAVMLDSVHFVEFFLLLVFM